MGGQFTLSDDSHGVAQVATHYAQTLAFLDKNGIESLVFFEKTITDSSSVEGATNGLRITKKTVSVQALREKHPFFS